MTPRRRLLSASLLLALAAPFAPACDYDAAYRTWCYKNGGCAEVPPAGDGGVHYFCTDCEGADQVCVVLGNVAQCKKTCTGFISSCPEGLDCKPVPAAYQLSMVPACVSSGAGTSVDACQSPLQCTAGHTCFRGTNVPTEQCLELCTPFKRECASKAQKCAWNDSHLPADWGYCY
ncbi:MAG: hypothetical protein QM765_28230 [Myxococcales bacterium]